MKKNMLTVGLVVTAACLLASMAPVRTAPSSGGWIQKTGASVQADDVTIMYDLILSEPYVRAGDTSQSVRLMTTVLRLTANGTIALNCRHDLRSIPLTGRDPVELPLDPVNLANVATFAKQALGLPADPGELQWSPSYLVSIAPSEGKAWGEVTDKAEIDVTVTAKRDG